MLLLVTIFSKLVLEGMSIKRGDLIFFFLILLKENCVKKVINLLKVLKQGSIHSNKYDLTKLLIEPLLE